MPSTLPTPASGQPPTAAPKLAQSVQFSSNREIASVQADYLALANDLEQAQALAAALEMQLSGKTNELANMKSVWERARGDLAKFERDIEALRKERHALANQVQRAYALEHKYDKVQQANQELIERAERLERELNQERSAHAETRELASRSARPSGAAAGSLDPELQRELEAVRRHIDRALSGSKGSPTRGPFVREPASEPVREHIDIQFSA